MECAFCGNEISDGSFRRDGEIFCSRECANASTAEQFGLESIDYEDDLNEDSGEYYYEEDF